MKQVFKEVKVYYDTEWKCEEVSELKLRNVTLPIEDVEDRVYAFIGEKDQNYLYYLVIQVILYSETELDGTETSKIGKFYTLDYRMEHR